MLYGTNPTGTTGVSRNGFISWLRGLSQIYPVTNTTTRAQFAAAEGVPAASTTNPLLVYRADAAAYAKVELNDGTGWSGLIQGDTGWVAATEDAAFDGNSSVSSRKIGPVVYLAGVIRPDAGTVGAGATTGLVATLPTGHRPGADKRLCVTQWVEGATPELRADALVEVKSNGQVRVINGASSAATGTYLDGASFVVD